MQEPSATPRASENLLEPTLRKIQDYQRTEVVPLRLIYLLITLLDYVESGLTGALSRTEKDQRPISFTFANEFYNGLDMHIDLSYLLLVSHHYVLLSEE